MILTHDYRRVQANWGSDGDFVTPEGKTIYTGENHTIYMMDHPELFDGSDDPEDMIGKGWVRTRGYGSIYSIDAGGGMNKTQLDILQKMVQERCQYSDPQIEVLLNEDLYNWSCDDFIMLKYPNQIKRGLRYGSRRVAHVEKNYWVGPDGEIVNLEGSYHGSFAAKHPEVFGDLSKEAREDALSGESLGEKIVDEVIGLGWCRVMGWQGSMNIQFGDDLNTDQLHSLQRIASSIAPRKILFFGYSPIQQIEMDLMDLMRLKYSSQISKISRYSAKGIPFITKKDLRFTREGDPWVDEDWLESGLKRLLTFRDEHYSYTGKKKRDEDGKAIFLYEAGQNKIWVGKNRQVYQEH